MSFYGSSFSFDGKSCEEFGLMLYDFNNTTQGNSKFESIDIKEDWVYQRPRSLFYGATHKGPLEFQLVFGADEYSAAQREPIDRQDMEVIGSWLLGHNTYKWLEIDQPDMDRLRYRCIITDLETIEVGFAKWAFSCKVHCDSPYAYHYPKQYVYHTYGLQNIVLHSDSSMNGIYYPNVSIRLLGGGSFVIDNKDTGKSFRMSGLPDSIKQIDLDGENGILSSPSGLNVYKYSNFAWPGLIRGDNHISLIGSGIVTFTCEFPANIGG